MSLVNGDPLLLERKYGALPEVVLWERLIDLCLVDCHDEIRRDLCGITFKRFAQYRRNLQHMRRSVNLNRLLRECDANSSSHIVFENQRTQKNTEYFPRYSEDC